MAITSAAMRPALRAWAARQAHTLEALQRALEIVYRDRPGARRIDDIVEALLLRVANGHEAQVAGRLAPMEGALGRLLDDLDTLRSAASQGRVPALREADLHVLAETMSALVRFEDHVRFLLDESAPDVHNSLRDLLATAPQPPAAAGRTADDLAAAATAVRPLASTRQRGQAMLDWAVEIYNAWRRRRTHEPAGVRPVEVPWPDHPTLVAAMERMAVAVDRYRSLTLHDPAAAAHAVDDLRHSVAEANETLRSFGRRFEAVVTGDRIPPSRPAAGRPAPAAGSAAHTALVDADTVLTRLGRRGLRTKPPADLFDAMHFSDLEVKADGVLGQPLSRRLPGMGLEVYALTAGDISALPTRPAWLAKRLAELVDGWERAHLIGPGFGGELFAGLMSAPWGVNQVAQNKGVEAFLRAAAAAGGEVDVVATARGRRLAIPLANGAFEYVDVLGSVHYQATGVRPPPLHFDITVHPDGSWEVAHNLPAGAVGADVPLRGSR